MAVDLESILLAGRQRREGPQATLRHALLEGVLRRIARLPEAGVFVLRGGLLTRNWIAPWPRPTRDLDFLGDAPFDVEAVAWRLHPILSDPLDDGIHLDPATFQASGIWLHTEFPGVRVALRVGFETPEQEVTLDIGFGDPLVPPAVSLEYTTLAGDCFPVRAVRPETQLAWKLHGLAEMGTEWRPKDLADLWRIVQRVPLDETLLPGAISAAFLSRGFTLDDAVGVLRRDHWATKTAQVRWGKSSSLPELNVALADVRRALERPLQNLERTTP